MANLKDLKQADDAVRAVILLTKPIVGDERSQKIADVSLPDLCQGWNLSGLHKKMILSVMNAYLKLERLMRD